MTAPHDDAATDLQAIVAQLRADLDAALAQKDALASRLTRRDLAYEERMAHQSATSGVLKAMSASPGDPQPVSSRSSGMRWRPVTGATRGYSNTMAISCIAGGSCGGQIL